MANRPNQFLIKLEGDEQAKAVMLARVKEILDSLVRAGGKIGHLVAADVQDHFDTPGALRTRSGWLKNAVASSVQRRLSGVRVNIGIRGRVPYAAALIYGKVTKPHLIRPRRARALRWTASAAGGPGVLAPGAARSSARSARQGAGDETFARAMKHPGSRIPARPIIQAGVLRQREAIEDMFLEAVQRAIEK